VDAQEFKTSKENFDREEDMQAGKDYRNIALESVRVAFAALYAGLLIDLAEVLARLRPLLQPRTPKDWQQGEPDGPSDWQVEQPDGPPRHGRLRYVNGDRPRDRLTPLLGGAALLLVAILVAILLWSPDGPRIEATTYASAYETPVLEAKVSGQAHAYVSPFAMGRYVYLREFQARQLGLRGDAGDGGLWIRSSANNRWRPSMEVGWRIHPWPWSADLAGYEWTLQVPQITRDQLNLKGIAIGDGVILCVAASEAVTHQDCDWMLDGSITLWQLMFPSAPNAPLAFTTNHFSW
jgi:hypothetical protein